VKKKLRGEMETTRLFFEKIAYFKRQHELKYGNNSNNSNNKSDVPAASSSSPNKYATVFAFPPTARSAATEPRPTAFPPGEKAAHNARKSSVDSAAKAQPPKGAKRTTATTLPAAVENESPAAESELAVEKILSDASVSSQSKQRAAPKHQAAPRRASGAQGSAVSVASKAESALPAVSSWVDDQVADMVSDFALNAVSQNFSNARLVILAFQVVFDLYGSGAVSKDPVKVKQILGAIERAGNENDEAKLDLIAAKLSRLLRGISISNGNASRLDQSLPDLLLNSIAEYSAQTDFCQQAIKLFNVLPVDRLSELTPSINIALDAALQSNANNDDSFDVSIARLKRRLGPLSDGGKGKKQKL